MKIASKTHSIGPSRYSVRARCLARACVRFVCFIFTCVLSPNKRRLRNPWASAHHACRRLFFLRYYRSAQPFFFTPVCLLLPPFVSVVPTAVVALFKQVKFGASHVHRRVGEKEEGINKCWPRWRQRDENEDDERGVREGMEGWGGNEMRIR